MNKGDWEDWRRSVINCKSVLHASGIYVGDCKRRKFAGGRSGASISSFFFDDQTSYHALTTLEKRCKRCASKHAAGNEVTDQKIRHMFA